MPILNTDNLDQHKLPTNSYGYSAARIGDLGATEYTLVTICNDVSSSVSSYKDDMEKALKQIITACRSSPRADNLMIRFVQFASNLSETHGFKLLQQCNVDNYDNCLQVGGMTALYDSAENSIKATADYAKKLANNDFQVNGIVFIVTDGGDNASVLTTGSVKDALACALKEESLESLITILIGVGIENPQIGSLLNQFKDEAGLTQYIECKNADSKTLSRLAAFVSKSISSQSNSLGSRSASQPLAF